MTRTMKILSFFRSARFALAGAALIGATGMAQAQDGFDFSGFYAGIHLDASTFAAESSDLTDTFTNDAPSLSELVYGGGVTLGYNYQLGNNVIIGAELDYTSAMEVNRFVAFNSSGSQGLDFQNSWESVIALKLRAGITQDRSLFYVTGGPAQAKGVFSVRDVQVSNSDCGDSVCAEADENLLGLVIGVGAEHAFTDRIIGKFEVLHYAMPNSEAPILLNQDTPNCGAALGEECAVYFDSSATTVRFGMNFKF